MKDLIIVGASGFGKEVAWLVEKINSDHQLWNLLGFLDDNEALQGKTINGYQVLGKTGDAGFYSDAFFVCAVGSAKVRKRIVEKLFSVNNKIQFGTLVDPSVEVSNTVYIGAGSIVCAHTILTVNIQIGNHTILNLDCTVGHDAVLKDYVTAYPSVNISGQCIIGSEVELGTGANIIQGLQITDHTIIGAGTVVIKDILEPGTYVGIPARKTGKESAS